MYCSYDFEKIKFEPVKLIKLTAELFEDIKLCYDFDRNGRSVT